MELSHDDLHRLEAALFSYIEELDDEAHRNPRHKTDILARRTKYLELRSRIVEGMAPEARP